MQFLIHGSINYFFEFEINDAKNIIYLNMFFFFEIIIQIHDHCNLSKAI